MGSYQKKRIGEFLVCPLLPRILVAFSQKGATVRFPSVRTGKSNASSRSTSYAGPTAMGSSVVPVGPLGRSSPERATRNSTRPHLVLPTTREWLSLYHSYANASNFRSGLQSDSPTCEVRSNISFTMTAIVSSSSYGESLYLVRLIKIDGTVQDRTRKNERSLST